MDFSRINQSHVWIIGSVVIVLTGAIIYFVFLQGINNALTAATTYDANQTQMAGQLPGQKTATLNAKTNLLKARVEHIEFDRKNPSFVVDMSKPVSRWNGQRSQELEVMRVMTPLLQAFFRRISAGLAAGSTMRVKDETPSLAAMPSQTFATSPITYNDIGSLDLYGTYAQLQRFLLRIPQAPRIITLGPLALDSSIASNATSLNPGAMNLVHATVDFSLYEFVKGVSTGAGGGGASGGMGGGGMGGYPGGGGGYPGGGGGYPSAGGGYPSAGGGYPSAGAGPAATAKAATS